MNIYYAKRERRSDGSRTTDLDHTRLTHADVAFIVDEEFGVMTTIKDRWGRASLHFPAGIKPYMPALKLSMLPEIKEHLETGELMTKEQLARWRSRDQLDTTFFVADPHFDHEKIMKLSDRPWELATEYLYAYVNAHNWMIDNKCTVYWLGDFGFCSTKRVDDILQSLRGKHTLVTGNHDDNRIKRAQRWREVTPYKEARIGGRKVVMFHYPIYEWNGWHKGALHVYGHVHQNDFEAVHDRGAVNVGVDATGYRPISAREAFKQMSKQKFEASREMQLEGRSVR